MRSLAQLEQRSLQLQQSSAGDTDLSALTARVEALETRLAVTANSSPDGDDVLVSAEAAKDTDGNGGTLTLRAGVEDGAGAPGQILLSGLPTADPHVNEALWNDGGTVKVSAG